MPTQRNLWDDGETCPIPAKSYAFFSTHGGVRTPRTLYDGLPPRVVYADPESTMNDMIALLRKRWPLFCMSIFARSSLGHTQWNPQWFFDEYDWYFYGPEFIHALLFKMQRQNEARVTTFVNCWNTRYEKTWLGHNIPSLTIETAFDSIERASISSEFLKMSLYIIKDKWFRVQFAVLDAGRERQAREMGIEPPQPPPPRKPSPIGSPTTPPFVPDTQSSPYIPPINLPGTFAISPVSGEAVMHLPGLLPGQVHGPRLPASGAQHPYGPVGHTSDVFGIGRSSTAFFSQVATRHVSAPMMAHRQPFIAPLHDANDTKHNKPNYSSSQQHHGRVHHRAGRERAPNDNSFRKHELDENHRIVQEPIPSTFKVTKSRTSSTSEYTTQPGYSSQDARCIPGFESNLPESIAIDLPQNPQKSHSQTSEIQTPPSQIPDSCSNEVDASTSPPPIRVPLALNPAEYVLESPRQQARLVQVLDTVEEQDEEPVTIVDEDIPIIAQPQPINKPIEIITRQQFVRAELDTPTWMLESTSVQTCEDADECPSVTVEHKDEWSPLPPSPVSSRSTPKGCQELEDWTKEFETSWHAIERLPDRHRQQWIDEMQQIKTTIETLEQRHFEASSKLADAEKNGKKTTKKAQRSKLKQITQQHKEAIENLMLFSGRLQREIANTPPPTPPPSHYPKLDMASASLSLESNKFDSWPKQKQTKSKRKHRRTDTVSSSGSSRKGKTSRKQSSTYDTFSNTPPSPTLSASSLDRHSDTTSTQSTEPISPTTKFTYAAIAAMNAPGSNAPIVVKQSTKGRNSRDKEWALGNEGQWASRG